MVFCCFIIPIPRIRSRRTVIQRRVYLKQRQADGSVILIPQPQQRQQPIPVKKVCDCTKSQCCLLALAIVTIISIFVACATFHNIKNYETVKRTSCLCTGIDDNIGSDSTDITYHFQAPYPEFACDDMTIHQKDDSTYRYEQDIKFYCWILQTSQDEQCKINLDSNRNPYEVGVISFSISMVVSIICIMTVIWIFIGWSRRDIVSFCWPRIEADAQNKNKPDINLQKCSAQPGQLQLQTATIKKQLTPMQQAMNSMTQKGYFKSDEEWVNNGDMSGNECEGSVFINGVYNGWYMMTMRGTPKHSFVFDLEFDTNGIDTVNGFGIDDIGEYMLNGIYNRNNLRISLRKQYINKHAVQIRLEYKQNEKEFIGAWHIRYSKVGDKIDFNASQKNCIKWGAYGFSLIDGDQKDNNLCVEGTHYMQLPENNNVQ